MNHYDGYNIPFTDQTTNPFAQAPVSGFYITNISASLSGNSIALEPCNVRHETRIFPADRVKVQGRMVALLRRYT